LVGLAKWLAATAAGRGIERGLRGKKD
jgi:hypothetical protein